MVAGVNRDEHLYERALAIQEGRANGMWVPIMRHLALRGHLPALVELASWLSQDNVVGALRDPSSAGGLYRRAYRAGSANAAQNLAMSCFNTNNLAGYRHWLRRAAQAGDANAGQELRQFETRLPHTAARSIGRHRPERRSDLRAWK